MEFQNLFPNIPNRLIKSLKIHYTKIKENYIENRFGPSELNGAKFSEVVFRILEWHTSTDKSYTPLGTSIRNFDNATRKFENKSNFPDSIRFHIPKILNTLYSIRNKRGVGHVGGDVDPNYMDALFVVSAADWIMAELVRIFHNISIPEAQKLVESIVSRKMPLVWDIQGRKRILQPSMSYKEKVLLLLYSEHPKPITDRTLFEWTEHSRFNNFSSSVLIPLHKEKLVEYDKNSKEVYLSPKGLIKVENFSLNTQQTV